MSWFGLFDRLRLRNGSGVEGLPMPGSQLLLADPNAAALYRDAIREQGETYRADLFDIAGHDLSRRTQPAPGSYHLDVRLTGRPQGILFHGDAGHGLISWHAETGRGVIRLAGGGDGVAMDAMALLPLLEQTVDARAIASLSIWAPDVASAAALLRGLAPRLVRDATAILRLPPGQLSEALATMADWPARCAAVLPCTGAADEDGRGEEPTSLLLCLEQLSVRPMPTTAIAPAPMRRDVWNGLDRAARMTRLGGVAIQMPLPDRTVTGGWTIGFAGDIPPTSSGMALAQLQGTAFRAQAGFDYVVGVDAATVIESAGVVFVVPQDGPVVVSPHSVIGADAVQPMAAGDLAAGLQGMLSSCGVGGAEGFAATRGRLVQRVSQRTAFLLAGRCPDHAYVSELWPTLEYAFQFCERNRLALSDIDILIPGVSSPVVHDSLALLGVARDAIITDPEPVLFRRILMATPASRGDTGQRSAAYDQFWARARGMIRTDSHASFMRPRRSRRVMLTGGPGPALLNAQSLHAIARRHGYEVIDPADMTLGELAAVLANAASIVGAGAQMAWTCLARTAAIGIVQADSDPMLPYAVLHAASTNGFGVSVAFGSGIGDGPARALTLAPDRFEALLNRVDAASQSGPRAGQISVASEAAR